MRLGILAISSSLACTASRSRRPSPRAAHRARSSSASATVVLLWASANICEAHDTVQHNSLASRAQLSYGAAAQQCGPVQVTAAAAAAVVVAAAAAGAERVTLFSRVSYVTRPRDA